MGDEAAYQRELWQVGSMLICSNRDGDGLMQVTYLRPPNSLFQTTLESCKRYVYLESPAYFTAFRNPSYHLRQDYRTLATTDEPIDHLFLRTTSYMLVRSHHLDFNDPQILPTPDL